ncbi:MAG: hypothetical protein KAH18_10565 [Psychromonas sp.]|nr:hypothetical protein [Psychromonas sp.]
MPKMNKVGAMGNALPVSLPNASQSEVCWSAMLEPIGPEMGQRSRSLEKKLVVEAINQERVCPRLTLNFDEFINGHPSFEGFRAFDKVYIEDVFSEVIKFSLLTQMLVCGMTELKNTDARKQKFYTKYQVQTTVILKDLKLLHGYITSSMQTLAIVTEVVRSQDEAIAREFSKGAFNPIDIARLYNNKLNYLANDKIYIGDEILYLGGSRPLKILSLYEKIADQFFQYKSEQKTKVHLVFKDVLNNYVGGVGQSERHGERMFYGANQARDRLLLEKKNRLNPNQNPWEAVFNNSF